MTALTLDIFSGSFIPGRAMNDDDVTAGDVINMTSLSPPESSSSVGGMDFMNESWKQSSLGWPVFFILPLAGLAFVANAITWVEILRDDFLKRRKLYAYYMSLAACDVLNSAIVSPLAVAKAYSGMFNYMKFFRRIFYSIKSQFN